MSYLVLARKYRPQTFDDVIGQEEVVRQLKGALQSGRVPHAMLFSGPRGTGKTTCARILARELNKIAPAVQGSLDLDSGMDVIEIDAASNRSIDDIRTLRENVRFVPLSGAFKIYIIDEAHMLTTEAFNALLKTLEEPPAHVKFILATTDPNKMPVTILSRCQRFAFKRIKLDLMVRKLAEICEKEGFSVEEEALFAVARAGQGGMRDALSVLDQLGAASEGGKVLVQDVNAMFGFVGAESLFELAGALARHDCGEALRILEGILEHGKDIRQMMMDLMDLYRDVLVMISGGKELEALLDQPRAYKESLAHLAGLVSVPSALAAIDILIEAQEMARVTESPRLALDVAFARISALSSDGGRPASSATPVVPAVRPPVPPRATPSGRLQNNKGSVSIGPVSLGPQSREGGAVGVSVSDIEREWTALTHAVSQVKMSAGTCLQEGFVSRIEKGGVVVSFPSEAAFSKEMLESSETLKMLGRVFSEHMKTPLRVTLEVSQGEAPRAERAEALDQALKIFGGEVVNEWHNEEAS